MKQSCDPYAPRLCREIEHKYLAVNDTYRAMATSAHTLTQGYLCRNSQCVVRVRIADDSAFITVKGRTYMASRQEFEYEIPKGEAEAMLKLCKGEIISKTRYIVPYDGCIWEVDEFHGRLQGLVIAEIELMSAGQQYCLPPFVGKNVTDNPNYYNSNLTNATEPPAEP